MCSFEKWTEVHADAGNLETLLEGSDKQSYPFIEGRMNTALAKANGLEITIRNTPAATVRDVANKLAVALAYIPLLNRDPSWVMVQSAFDDLDRLVLAQL